MARPRLTDWLATASTAAPTPSRGAAADRDVALMLSALRSKSPGQWSQNVLELARHFTGAAYLAVHTLAKHAMDSTFSLYERTEDPEAPNGEVQLPWHDPAHRLFEDPNPVDTFADLMYQSVQQLSITGLTLTWSVPSDDADEPREMYNLPTANCWPMPPGYHNGFAYPHGAYRVLPYPFGMLSAPMGQITSGAIIPAEQIVRTKQHHPFLRYDGYAVMSAISQEIDTLEAIGTSRSNTMLQGCEQSLALKTNSPTASDPDEPMLARLRSQFQALYAGPKNAGKVIIVPVGWDLSQVSTVPKDMAWQEGWSQVLDFILAAWGVPKAVAGLQDSVSYATLYSSLRAFCLFSLGPIVRLIARSWGKHVVRPAWGPAIGLRINAPEFKDETLEETKIGNDLKAGIRLVREMRRSRGYDELNPQDHPWVNDRAIASFSPQSPTGGGDGGRENDPEGNGPRLNDPNVDNARPATKADRLEALARAFETAKTNGHAHPIRG
jgi:hypothetical protein